MIISNGRRNNCRDGAWAQIDTCQTSREWKSLRTLRRYSKTQPRVEKRSTNKRSSMKTSRSGRRRRGYSSSRTSSGNTPKCWLLCSHARGYSRAILSAIWKGGGSLLFHNRAYHGHTNRRRGRTTLVSHGMLPLTNCVWSDLEERRSKALLEKLVGISTNIDATEKMIEIEKRYGVRGNG